MDSFNYSIVKNPQIFMENRLPAHSDHIAYASETENTLGCTSLRRSLNGIWKFNYAVNQKQAVEGFESPNYSCDDWDDIPVPAHIQMQGYDKPHYTNTTYPWDGHEWIEPGEIPAEFNPVASYVKSFTLPAYWKDNKICISFEGVESGFAVWINGQYVGYSEDSFDAADFDISDYVSEGENKLAVRVWKWTPSSWCEDQDFFRFSGIFRDVYIYTIPKAHIRDIKIKPELSDDYSKGEVSLALDVMGQGSVRVTLYDSAIGVLRPDIRKLKERDVVFENSYSLETAGNIDFEVIAPKLWSAEFPNLYVLRLELSDSDGQITEIITENVGFRRFEMINGIMCLNGERIVFKGVNRHEFSAVKGRVPDYDDLLKDITVMKQNNINGIRTSHYPNCSHIYDNGEYKSGIYELCDVFGLYMIAENNMETHGTWEAYGRGYVDQNFVVPMDNDIWKDMLLDRVTSTYETNKNHPSILIWSLGNESFGGKVINSMADKFRELDSTRLIHYEGICHDRRYPNSSDMESQMYPSVASIEQFLKDNPKKPFICCEYTHAMGNSCGGMHLYTELTDREARYQGGFIWDYIDQSIYKKDRYGKEFLAYGGDFGDRPSDYEFSGNGIAYGGSREPSPKMQSVKYNYQNIEIQFENDNIIVINKNLFTDTAEYNSLVTLYADGVKIKESLTMMSVKPGSRGSFDFPKDIAELKEELKDSGKELSVIVSFVLGNDTIWAGKGHEVAFGQIVYKKAVTPVVTDKAITFVRGNSNIGVKGENFSVIFSRIGMGLVSYVYAGKEMIDYIPRPNFWRAPTNNDEGNMFPQRYAQWKIASMYVNTRLKERFEDASPIVEDLGQTVKVTYKYKLPTTPSAEVKVSYEVFGDGTIETTMHYDQVEELGDMPEFGMLFKLPADYDRVKWYGLGPMETYADRVNGAKLGIYANKVSDNMAEYLVPQECGNKCGVRYIQVTDKNGSGLEFSGDELSVNVLPYTPHEIENAAHVYELPPVHYTVVRVAKTQMGIAGDDSWGAKTLPQYLIDVSEPIDFTFRFKGI